MGLVQQFENVFKAMKPALIDNKSAFVWLTNLPHPAYNLVTHFSCPDEEMEDFFDFLVKKFPPYIPHLCWVHPENQAKSLERILLERGYKFLATFPIMTWQVEGVEQPLFDIRKARDMQAFYNILAITSKYDQIIVENVATFLANANAEHYMGYFEGKPVGIGTLFLNGKTAVVSSLATLKEYQRKGCGRALMLALMNRAQERDFSRSF